MTEIKTIKAYVETGSSSGAGTNAYIYLGIGGREFALVSSEASFSAGAKYTYVFGAGSNVSNPDYNNPVLPQIHTEHLNETPVYIRSDGSGSAEPWEIADIKVTIHTNDGSKPTATYASRLVDGKGTFWLGAPYGLRTDLVRMS